MTSGSKNIIKHFKIFFVTLTFIFKLFSPPAVTFLRYKILFLIAETKNLILVIHFCSFLFIFVHRSMLGKSLHSISFKMSTTAFCPSQMEKGLRCSFSLRILTVDLHLQNNASVANPETQRSASVQFFHRRSWLTVPWALGLVEVRASSRAFRIWPPTMRMSHFERHVLIALFPAVTIY